MKDTDRYFQFPLWMLTADLEPWRLGNSLISYGGMLAGHSAFQGLSEEKRYVACQRVGLGPEAYQSWELVARLGEEVLAMRFGDRKVAIDHFQAVNRDLARHEAEHGREPLVRVRKGMLFDFAKGNTLDGREFRVLMAIYSSIGSRPYSTIPLRLIRVRAMGWKTEAVYAREYERGNDTGLFTPKQIRSTVTRLHELGWYARVTPSPHGRVTYYSHRLSHDQLREKIFIRRTRAKTFADEHREKNAELVERIREARCGDAERSGGGGSGHPGEANGSSAVGRSTPSRSASILLQGVVPAVPSRAGSGEGAVGGEVAARLLKSEGCGGAGSEVDDGAGADLSTLSQARLRGADGGSGAGTPVGIPVGTPDGSADSTKSQSTGYVGTWQGLMEGTFNRNAVDRNSLDRNAGRGHSDHLDRCPPSLSELKKMGYAQNHSEILDYVNRKLVPLGYLPVDAFSSAVVHICNTLFPFLDYRSTIDQLAEDGPPKKGEATFYRLAWERYGMALAPLRDKAYWDKKRRETRAEGREFNRR